MKSRKLSFADFAENELTRKQKTYITGRGPTTAPSPGEPLPGQPIGDIRDGDDIEPLKAVLTLP